ncbi:hypothetical protein ACFQ3Z_00550 [Streptomyces nogalater]
MRPAWRRDSWLAQEQKDDEAYVQRSTRYIDEFRARQKKTIALFSSNGVSSKPRSSCSICLTAWSKGHKP